MWKAEILQLHSLNKKYQTGQFVTAEKFGNAFEEYQSVCKVL